MNKNDIIRKLAGKHDKSVSEIKHIVDDFLDEVMRGVGQKKAEVHLVGFGKFLTLTRKARKGRNPQTGEEIQLPESKRIAFTPGSLFKRFLS